MGRLPIATESSHRVAQVSAAGPVTGLRFVMLDTGLPVYAGSSSVTSSGCIEIEE
jgi:hypothetical protein